MPFPQRNTYRPYYFGYSQTVTENCTERGYITTERVPDIGILPDPELYDLENAVRAGIPIQQVSTKIVGSGLGSLARTLEDTIQQETTAIASNIDAKKE